MWRILISCSRHVPRGIFSMCYGLLRLATDLSARNQHQIRSIFGKSGDDLDMGRPSAESWHSIDEPGNLKETSWLMDNNFVRSNASLVGERVKLKQMIGSPAKRPSCDLMVTSSYVSQQRDRAETKISSSERCLCFVEIP